MKNNLYKRILSFVIITFLSLTITSKVFAAETSISVIDKIESNTTVIPFSVDSTDIQEYTLNIEDSGDIPSTNIDANVFSNPSASGLVPANGTLNLYPRLYSYVGLNKNFIVNAVSESTTGGLFLYLYNPSGKLVSDDWIMSTNEVAKWNIFLPSSGEWHLYIVGSATNAPVDVYARWE